MLSPLLLNMSLQIELPLLGENTAARAAGQPKAAVSTKSSTLSYRNARISMLFTRR
jgi:hypothetical protein